MATSHFRKQWWLDYRHIYSLFGLNELTHCGRDKLAANYLTFSNAFSWMKIYIFRLRFHWSLFPRIQSTIFHRRSGDKPLSGPMMFSLLTQICVTRPQWVNTCKTVMAQMGNGPWHWITVGQDNPIKIYFNKSTRRTITVRHIYKSHQIRKLKCFSSCSRMCQIHRSQVLSRVKDVFGASPTGDFSTTFQWATIISPNKVRLISEFWRYIKTNLIGCELAQWLLSYGIGKDGWGYGRTEGYNQFHSSPDLPKKM